MPEVSLKLDCPNCRFPVKAFIEDDGQHEFLLFVCLNCHKNVVFYDNKLDIISDKMVKKLLRKNKLKICGELKIIVENETSKPISGEDITNLKIALETSKDVDDFLHKI